MGNRFSSGRHAISECDRCGFRFKLTELRKETIKTKQYNLKVCKSCWSPAHPQLQLGMYPVDDPQGVREPRPDTSYVASGVNVLGYPSEGSRDFQWGWNPVGGARGADAGATPNYLVLSVQVGTVTVQTT